MYNLYASPTRHWGGQIIPSRFKDVRHRIAEDVDKVVQYYRSGTFMVPNQHLLVRLIGAMNVPLHYDLGRYVETALARSLLVANSFQFTSSINKGKWFLGQFYFECPELIIAYTSDEDPVELAKSWRNLQPVKPLDHPVSNLRYMLPNGRKHNVERGLAVIGIDLVELMVQYRGFCLDQQWKIEEGAESVLGPTHFVGKYVIPNMLYRQTDLAILNRLINLEEGAPMGDSLKRLPFFTSDYSELLDRGLEELLQRFHSVKLGYREILDQVPFVFNDRPWQMPDMAETRQVWWALFLTRLKLTEFLVEVAGETGRHYNQSLLNPLAIDLKRFITDNVFSKGLPMELVDDIPYRLAQLLKLATAKE